METLKRDKRTQMSHLQLIPLDLLVRKRFASRFMNGSDGAMYGLASMDDPSVIP